MFCAGYGFGAASIGRGGCEAEGGGESAASAVRGRGGSFSRRGASESSPPSYQLVTFGFLCYFFRWFLDLDVFS